MSYGLNIEMHKQVRMQGGEVNLILYCRVF